MNATTSCTIRTFCPACLPGKTPKRYQANLAAGTVVGNRNGIRISYSSVPTVSEAFVICNRAMRTAPELLSAWMTARCSELSVRPKPRIICRYVMQAALVLFRLAPGFWGIHMNVTWQTSNWPKPLLMLPKHGLAPLNQGYHRSWFHEQGDADGA